MVSVKLIFVALAAQLLAAVAFTAPASHRSVHQAARGVSSTAGLFMAVAAPEKKKEKKVTNESDEQSDMDKDRGWLVRLYNDPFNKREFVARCLMEVCGHDDGTAFTVMMQAHQVGIGVIGNYHRELAEMYKMRLSEEGLLIDMVPADDE
ncbi:hypothetical protein ACHAXT_007597 [Thalassiosira profunda]